VPLGIAVAVAAALAFVAELPAAPDEPLFARWLRCAADHPLRTSLAAALTAWALRAERPGA
jgi:hypothetical protein